MENIKHLDEADEIMELPISWEEKGKKAGRLDEKRNIARLMLKKRLPIQLIVEVTGLEPTEVKKL